MGGHEMVTLLFLSPTTQIMPTHPENSVEASQISQTPWSLFPRGPMGRLRHPRDFILVCLPLWLRPAHEPHGDRNHICMDMNFPIRAAAPRRAIQ